MERSVEGVHSLISRTLRRSPAAKIPYLSMEVRWSQLLAAAVKGPEEPGQPEFEQVWLAGFGLGGPGLGL